ncbi:MAG: CerR family C-terminal domain-containing protein [Desulfobulbaceae bacterium]|nr:CerR family C-terminal domain-containing protein [Desulfobulbaceae bacterium]
MAQREDGKETRNRLLNAACEVFAEKGYRNAKVAEICRRADANVAAVNYYFGDKASLYTEAWRHAFNKYAISISSDWVHTSPDDQLKAYIQTLMQNFMVKGQQGYFTRLYMMELANPTGLIQDTWLDLIEPRRQKLLGIICKIMGVETTNETVLFCEMSIINQCRALLTINRNDLEYLLDQSLTPDLIKRLADHIACFSLAGIRAVSNSKI